MDKRFTLRLLGEFQIAAPDGAKAAVPANKNRALVACLALARGSLTRERLTGLLWSRSDAARASASLRTGLSQLKRDLAVIGADVLAISKTEVALEPESLLVDTKTLEHHCANGEWKLAAGQYRGEFLQHVALDDEPIGAWISEHRTKFRQLAADAAQRWASQCLSCGEFGAAVSAASHCLSLEPLKESAVHVLMRAHCGQGDSARALQVFRDLERRLREELGVSPDRQTCELAHSVRTGRLASSRPQPDERPQQVTDRPSIAVVPFEVMAAQDSSDLSVFADGLVEDVITALSRIRDFFVIARNTTFTYKGTSVDVQAVGRALGVRYVLEGSVRGESGRLRVVAQLVDSESREYVWADTYDRRVEDLFDTLDELTRSIVSSVQTHIVLREGRTPVFADARQRSERAALHRAGHLLYELSKENVGEAASIARAELAANPRSAWALRILSSCLFHQATMGYVTRRARALRDALAAARRSAELEEDNELTHWLIGNLELWSNFAHERAIAAFERCLEINPNYSLGYASLGNALILSGEFDRGIAQIHIALRSNPRDPYNFFRHQALAIAFFLQDQLAQANAWSVRVVHRRPDYYPGLLVHAAILAALERAAEAREFVDRVRAIAPDEAFGQLNWLPFRNDSDRKRLAEALSVAGFGA